MAWIYLIMAGIFEWGWPLGLKMGVTENAYQPLWLLFSAITMFVSGYLLLLAQRVIPMGTAYATWTGIGAVGTFLLGIIFFEDSAELTRFISVSLIIFGIIGLKMAHKA